MGQGNYKVVLTGSILEGFERTQVLAAAAKLFKCPEPQAERFLQGKPTALKREMDAATAERYEQQLNKVGIACRLEAITPAEPVLELSSAAEPSDPAEPVKPSLALTDAPSTQEQPPAALSGLSLESSPETVRATSASASAGETAGFRCPKCGTPQEQGEECIKCGIIFSRYQEAAPTETAAAASADEEAETSDLDELGLFVGENREKYRNKFARLYQNDGQYQTQWHWPAFLVPVPWMIYRKLYPWAAALIVLQMILPPIALAAVGISMGMMGNYLYYRHAMQRIGKITASGTERRDEIVQAGGTNSMLVTIGATFLIGLLTLFVYAQFFMPPEAKQALARHAEDRQEFAQVADSKTKQKMLLLKSLLGMQKAASAMTGKSFEMPRDMEELRKMLGAEPKATEDEWGSQMDLEVEGNSLTFYSPGEDKRFDTSDDVTVKTELR